MTSPEPAARKTNTAGAVPDGSAKPSVKMDEPASMKADAMPRLDIGHSSNV
jgi:hypothetical protein